MIKTDCDTLSLDTTQPMDWLRAYITLHDYSITIPVGLTSHQSNDAYCALNTSFSLILYLYLYNWGMLQLYFEGKIAYDESVSSTSARVQQQRYSNHFLFTT